jgi:hypothetical protein
MRRFAPVLLATLLMVAACGRVPTAMATDASGPRTSPPGPSPSPPAASTAPSPSVPPDWQIFTSPQVGYTMQYPPTWRYQGSSGGPYPSDYFSNENVGAPDQMDQSGIFLTIYVTGDAADKCLQRALRGATVERDDNVVIDGTPATLHVLSARGAPMMIVDVWHGGYCYEVDFITWNSQVRDANENTAQSILGTFRFGSGPRATPS